MSQNLVFTNDVAPALDAILDAKPHNHLAVIVDENTARVVLPKIRSRHLAEAQIITIGVTTGPIPEKDLYKAGADIVYPSMTALAEALPLLLEAFRATKQ
ncbi:MAG: hypothetical protein SPH08_04745 [Sodaliphilus sp.]|nr:hypothetical protein [Sodaliphilus sp.]